MKIPFFLIALFSLPCKTHSHTRPRTQATQLLSCLQKGGKMPTCPSFKYKKTLSNIYHVLLFWQQPETPNQNWPVGQLQDASIVQVLTERGTTPRGHTSTGGLRSPPKWHTIPTSRARRRKPLCSAGIVAKQKHQTQTWTLMWQKKTKGTGTAKTGKQNLGQKQLRSQISGSVSVGAVRSWGSRAGSGGGPPVLQPNNKDSHTCRVVVFGCFFLLFLFFLHLLSLKMQIKTR